MDVAKAEFFDGWFERFWIWGKAVRMQHML